MTTQLHVAAAPHNLLQVCAKCGEPLVDNRNIIREVNQQTFISEEKEQDAYFMPGAPIAKIYKDFNNKTSNTVVTQVSPEKYAKEMMEENCPFLD